MACALASGFSLGGCATHSSEVAGARACWLAGDYALAAADLRSLKDDSSDCDRLVWLLEYGAAARAAGELESSSKAFDEAENLIAKFEAEPAEKLGEEFAAVWTNQSFLTYRGTYYDKIMAYSYHAMNLMERGLFDEAEVRLKRLEFAQQNAVRLNAARIEKEAEALEKAQSGGSGYDAQRTLSVPAVKSELEAHYGGGVFSGGVPYSEAKKLYVNPFAYWLGGAYFAHMPSDASDIARGADFMRLAAESCGLKNSVLNGDAKLFDSYANGEISRLPASVYFVYECGTAPLRDQFRLDLPLFLFGNIPHVSVNFPFLKPEESADKDIDVAADSGRVKFETVADMDAIIEREFKSALPAMIARMVVSAAAKAAANYALVQTVRDNEFGVLALNIGFAVYQTAANNADLRTWTTLPKLVMVAKTPAPKNGIVRVCGRVVKVDPSGTTFVFVKKTSASARESVRTLSLKRGGKRGAIASGESGTKTP